ncbi:DNA recombination protein RmuC [Sphingomonas sp.]|uniref:DNA recombination protein RmuC n=1 Tax=Sphingomonas sp. TaxID=28214 RepID=UPI002FCB357A
MILDLLFILPLLLLGLGLGWFAGHRQAAAFRQERDAQAESFRRAIADLAAAEERAKQVPLLQAQVEALRAERDAALRETATLQADSRNFELRHKELSEARDLLSAQFSEIGGKLLQDAQKNFLERADARFGEARKENSAKLQLLLKPVEDTLKRYEEGLTRVEKDRVGSYHELKEAVEQVRVGQSQVRDEAAKLVNALRHSPKSRGRWGEQSLRNVLEQAGLSPYADYQSEVSVDTGDGRLRPDVIVRLPGGRKLIIDAKCSLNAFLDASEEVDEVLRLGHLKAHAASIRNHATQLGGKNYWQQFGDAADYVVMYIPGEHFLTAALEQDDGLWEWSFERRVLLATPTNLVAIARTVASVWRQEKIAEEAAEIARLGKELYERLAVAMGHLKRVGTGLNSAVENYNKFAASLDGRVMVSARRFRDLGIGSGAKEIEQIDTVDILAKTSSDALPALEQPDAEAAE